MENKVTTIYVKSETRDRLKALAKLDKRTLMGFLEVVSEQLAMEWPQDDFDAALEEARNGKAIT